MKQALQTLFRLIAEGIEFPDAAHRAANQHQVNQAELEREYDLHNLSCR
jgi:hypothetical protein